MFSKFRMETPQSVLRSVRNGDLQVPVHQNSHRYLPVPGPLFWHEGSPSSLYKGYGSCLRHPPSLGVPPPSVSRRLADSGVFSRGSDQGERLPFGVLFSSGDLYQSGEVELSPSQCPTYLGMRILSVPLRAFPTAERLGKFSLQLQEFLSSRSHPAPLWRSLLGRMSSLSLLILGSRLRMRSLQRCLKRSWDFRNDDSIIAWDDSCFRDLRWSNLTPGVPLEAPIPDVNLYTNASDQFWGGSLEGGQAWSLWSATERLLSINHRELLVVDRSLSAFRDQVQGLRVALFSDNTTTIAYLKKLGGTKFPTQRHHSVHPEGLRVLGCGSLPSVYSRLSQHHGGRPQPHQPSPWVGVDSLRGGLPGGSASVVNFHRSLCNHPEPPAACVFLPFWTPCQQGRMRCSRLGTVWRYMLSLLSP